MSDIKGIVAASRIGKKKKVMGTEEEADDELEKSGIKDSPSRVGKPPAIDSEKLFFPESRSGKTEITRAGDDGVVNMKGSVLNQQMEKSRDNFEDESYRKKDAAAAAKYKDITNQYVEMADRLKAKRLGKR